MRQQIRISSLPSCPAGYCSSYLYVGFKIARGKEFEYFNKKLFNICGHRCANSSYLITALAIDVSKYHIVSHVIELKFYKVEETSSSL